jgi:hypothetical protein
MFELGGEMGGADVQGASTPFVTWPDSSGPATGGTSVTFGLFGADGLPVQVFFGDAAAIVQGDIAISPAGVPGTVAVRVRVGDGEFVFPNGFTYLPTLPPLP